MDGFYKDILTLARDEFSEEEVRPGLATRALSLRSIFLLSSM